MKKLVCVQEEKGRRGMRDKVLRAAQKLGELETRDGISGRTSEVSQNEYISGERRRWEEVKMTAMDSKLI